MHSSTTSRRERTRREDPAIDARIESTSSEHITSEEDVSDGLVITDVSHVFGKADQRKVALKEVNLTVRKGTFVTLLGPSGCGKSTLLRIVAGLLKASHGEVSIFGRSVTEATRDKTIGFVPQTPALMPWRSIRDNVRLPLQVNRKADRNRQSGYRDPTEVLKLFGLGDVLDALPAQLSGGMRQRVAIARAFVFNPTILLMDEPFSALDELTREQQRHELLRIWQEDRKTVLFVTHSVAEAVALSDYVAVMSPRPGVIQDLIAVDLPRPRTADTEMTEAFAHIMNRVRKQLILPSQDRQAGDE